MGKGAGSAGGGGSSTEERRKKEVAIAMKQARRASADVQTFTLDHFVQGVVEWDIFGELHAEANGNRREREKMKRKLC